MQTEIWACVYTTLGVILATTINPLCGIYYGVAVIGLSQMPRIIKKNTPIQIKQSTNIGNQYMIHSV